MNTIHTYIISAECSPLNVDQVMFLLLKMRFPKEDELRIIDPYLISIVNVYDEDSDKLELKWSNDDVIISKKYL